MHAAKPDVLKRLAYIEGHLKGIRKMVDEDQYCVDILRQTYAVKRAIDRVPHTYVYALRAGPGDTFRQFAERAKSEAGWGYEELDVTHNPHITAPDLLVDLLERVARA